jgi:hypothetical protein
MSVEEDKDKLLYYNGTCPVCGKRDSSSVAGNLIRYCWKCKVVFNATVEEVKDANPEMPEV